MIYIPPRYWQIRLHLPILALLWVAVLPSASAQEAALAVPDGDVILRVSGNIGVTNSPSGAVFDYDMLAAMPATVISTSTPWTEGVVEFTGVALSDLMDRLSVSEGILRTVALNEYAVSIPVEDAFTFGPIIAYMRDGSPMTVRNRGPLWVIYPFDSSSTIDTEIYHHRSIWQLARIVVDAP